MCEKEMLEQLEDLIADRRSFLSNDKELSSSFQKDIDALKKVIHDYKILRDAAYRSMEQNGDNLTIWINENVKQRKVEILNIWNSDFDDVRCNALLYSKNKLVANIITSYDKKMIDELKYNIFHSKKDADKFVQVPFKNLIYDSFDKYLNLPKISKCSKLLNEIYDNVCDSDATMCHITEEDWKEYYSENFTEKDIQKLKEEVKKYGLEDIITFDDGEYKIVGYGNLETSFNDDRNISKNKDKEAR